GIQYGKMRRIVRLEWLRRRDDVPAQLAAARGASRFERADELMVVRLRREAADRNLHEIRIAEETCPVEIGAPHRLHHEMDRLSGLARLGLNAHGLQHVEHLG